MPDPKLAQDALKVSEERYALAMQASQDGYWDWNAKTQQFYASPRLLEIFGFAPDRVFGGLHDFCDAFPIFPEDRPGWDEALAHQMASTSPRFEREMRAKIHGQTRWIKVTGLISRDQSNIPVRWTGSAADITEFKRTALAFGLSEQRYALAMEAAQDAHWDWIVGADDYYVSPRALELYGFAPETTFKSRDDFLAKVPWCPEDKEAFRKAAAELFAGTGSRLSMELRANVRGEIRWIQANGVCMRDAHGKPVRWSGTGRDITERKRTEEALRLSEERYARAMDGSDAGHWDWNLLTDGMYVSPRAREMLALPAGNLPSTRAGIMALVPTFPEDQRSRGQIVDSLQSDRHERDYRVILPGGGIRWVSARAKVFRDAAGTVVRMTGSLTDITERKLALEALRESEERHALALEASEEGHFDWDVETDEIFVSPKINLLLDLPPGTSHGSRTKFLERVPYHPDDRAWLSEELAAVLAGKAERHEFDYRIRRKAGDERWLHARWLIRRNSLGAAVRVIGVLRDTTERKLAADALHTSEERYARAMQASDAGHWDWDIASDQMFQSAHMKQMLGFAPDTRFANRTEFIARQPFMAGERERLQETVRVALADPQGRYAIDYRTQLPDGEIRWMRSHGKVFRDDHGSPVRMTGSLTDVTERRQIEDELKAMERKLRQAQRLEAVGTLAGGIAHDFNNILGAILGFGEMALRDAPEGSRLQRDVKSVIKAGERGRALVERILGFSRSGMGKTVPVHVEDVVREALAIIGATLPESVRMEANLRAGHAAMLGDPTQVHQVVTNLVGNAIQAMPAGGSLLISLEALRVEKAGLTTTGPIGAGPYIVLRVSDSGVGMAATTVERIFDPFFTTKEVGGATGLGLSLVHGIVKSLGGGINVESALGKGSAFTVYLPRVGEVSSDKAEAPTDLLRGHGQRVLVVDDEEPLVRFTTETLRYLGYVPVPFTASSSALKAFRTDPDLFDALITDERMPGMSGSALIREVRTIRQDLPTILVSGYLEGAEAAQSQLSGADQVLRKPLLAIDLSACLARALAPRSQS